MLTRRPLRIALMGTRGIPAKYGGFETFYENLGPRLAERGHDVFVYVRPHMTEQPHLRRYRGTRLVPLPSIRHKHLETLSHTLLSTLHGLRKRYDVVLICGVGNAPVAWIPRLSGATVALNVDSADWNRTKWGRFARMYLRSSARVATHAVNVVVADNGAIQRHYREDLGAHVRFIAYGAEPIAEPGDDVLRELGVERRGYILWVGRLEPETKVDQLIAAFQQIHARDLHLVIVGDAPYAAAYRTAVRAMASPGVHFAGYRFGRDYRQLVTHAFAYVQTSPTAGTSPALLEEMAAGNAVIVRGTPMNREVAAEAGLWYEPDDPISGLARQIQRLIDEPETRDALRAAASERAQQFYTWEHIVDQYERLFQEMVRARAGRNA